LELAAKAALVALILYFPSVRLVIWYSPFFWLTTVTMSPAAFRTFIKTPSAGVPDRVRTDPEMLPHGSAPFMEGTMPKRSRL